MRPSFPSGPTPSGAPAAPSWPVRAALPAIVVAVLLHAAAPGLGAQEPDRPASGVGVTRTPVPRATATLTGSVRVRPEDGGGRLVHAMVTVRDSVGRARTVLTDTLGRYRVERLIPGTIRVRAAHVGYDEAALELVVPPGGVVSLELELTSRPLALRGIVVRADGRRASEPGETPVPAPRVVSDIDLRILETSPGLVESGIVRSGQPPGPPEDPGNVLLMRGSTADLKLVLLDGAPVYAPFHLGGLLPGFDPGLFARAEHHTGGAPARYDGGLSYILDLRTRPARRDRLHAEAAVDALSVRGTVESPLGERSGLLFSGRALHGVVGAAFFGGEGSPYGYRDALLRLDWSPGGSVVGLTAFSNRESVFLDLTGVGGEVSGGNGVVIGIGEEGDAVWGNDALAASWRGSDGGVDWEVSGAFSRYQAGLPLSFPVPSTVPGASADSVTVLASGRTDRARLAADVSLPQSAADLRLGVAFDRMDVSYGALPSDPFADRGGLEAEGTVVGGYLEGVRRLADPLDLEYGLRLDRFDPGGMRAAPRVTFLWRAAPGTRLTLTGGRYHQLTRRSEVDAELGAGSTPESATGAVPGPTATAGPLLGVATADHLVAALEQEVGESVHLRTELFLKDFRDVPGIATRHFTSSGMDLQVLHRRGERTAWLGYSLAWFWEPEEEPSRFSGRHLLTAGLATPLVGAIGASFRASFSDGLPLTAVRFDTGGPESAPGGLTTDGSGVVDGTGAPARPVDGFLRLDAEIFADWTRERGGREIRIRPYLRLLNALDRRDALFHYFEPWREDSLRPLVEVPLLPVLGLELRF